MIPNLYSIQTDFGLMEFDSDSVLGYWWTRIMNGESMFDLAKPVVPKEKKDEINEVIVFVHGRFYLCYVV